MKKGVLGGLIIAGLAGLAGLAGWTLTKKSSTATEAGESDNVINGSIEAGSSGGGGGVPNLISSFFSQGGGGSAAESDDIAEVLAAAKQPTDNAADNIQAAYLASAISEQNLNSTNQIYQGLIENNSLVPNADGSYNYNGYRYMDYNQLLGAFAETAARQTVGDTTYDSLSTGQRSVLLSSIRNGNAIYADSSAEVASLGGLVKGGNISNETYEALLAQTKAGTTPTTKKSSGGSSHLPSSTSYTAAADKAYSAAKSAESQAAAKAGTLEHHTRGH